MSTLTMQGVADLAHVRRPVVSMWRTRLAESEHPFPAPQPGDRLHFDADEVAHWLRRTGHGNNPEAHLEVALHSTATQRIEADLDRASALLLVHELLGGPVEGLDPAEAALRMAGHDVDAVLDAATVEGALHDAELCRAVDELAEAAFSGGHVLDRLLDTVAGPGGARAGEALTSAGKDLVGSVLAELQRDAPRVIVPEDAGSLVLAGALVDRSDDHDRTTFAVRPGIFDRPVDRAAWRHLAAHDFPLVSADPVGERPVGGGALHLVQQQDDRDPRGFFGLVEDVLVGLGPDDALVVVGPASLMTDRRGGGSRRVLLAPHDSYTAPLRYVARLPQGLSRFGVRRRLALWAFATPAARAGGPGWTVVGAHSDARIDAATRQAIAADVATALSTAADVNAHAFRSSSVLATDRLVRQSSLTAPARPPGRVEGGERLARVWELDDGLLSDLDVAASTGSSATIGLDRAARELGRDLRGTTIPRDLVDVAAAGRAGLIGPDEVRTPERVGLRAVDRLVIETDLPRARLTEPGDVVYVAAGGPAAVVDRSGGHVVQAPARVFRCHRRVIQGRRLVPSLVAADIAAQPGTDRGSWRLRTVPVDQADALDEIDRRARARRDHLRAELARLDALETELVDGLADGSLTAHLHPTTTTKAER